VSRRKSQDNPGGSRESGGERGVRAAGNPPRATKRTRRKPGTDAADAGGEGGSNGGSIVTARLPEAGVSMVSRRPSDPPRSGAREDAIDADLIEASSIPQPMPPDDEDLREILGEFPIDEDVLPVVDETEAEGTPREVLDAGPKKAAPGSRALTRIDPFTRYMAEIRRYPPLDREQEQELARAFRERGDREAASRLITANLALVVKIARLFRHAVSNALDLVQEGNVGLIMALDRFDPAVGVRFSTYAGWWIKAYILKYLLDNIRMVRVGTTNARRRLLYNLQREKRRLEEAGFTPGPKLLAERFGTTEKDVIEIEQSLSGGDLSLDAPVHEEADATRGEFLPSPGPSVEDEVAAREFKEILDGKLARFREGLPEREAILLDRRILAEQPATLQEIGDLYGITREAVRQAEKRLTERLKAYLSSELGAETVLQFRTHR
jgi:RNA polymerase sigma-32 factor